MQIKIQFEIHAYAEEKLCDEYLDRAPDFGIVGPEIILPLLAKRDSCVSFIYNEETTTGELLVKIKKEIWGSEVSELASKVEYSFVLNKERFYVSDKRQKITRFLSYLDPKNTGTITASILVSYNAGTVFTKAPLRFFVHSKEAGKHHEPHIHVCDSGRENEASFRISDGVKLAGALSPKLERLASKTILKDQGFFYQCWNLQTDGLTVDINHHYQFVEY